MLKGYYTEGRLNDKFYTKESYGRNLLNYQMVVDFVLSNDRDKIITKEQGTVIFTCYGKFIHTTNDQAYTDALKPFLVPHQGKHPCSCCMEFGKCQKNPKACRSSLIGIEK